MLIKDEETQGTNILEVVMTVTDDGFYKLGTTNSFKTALLKISDNGMPEEPGLSRRRSCL